MERKLGLKGIVFGLILGGVFFNVYDNYTKAEKVKKQMKEETLTPQQFNDLRERYFIYKDRCTDPWYEVKLPCK